MRRARRDVCQRLGGKGTYLSLTLYHVEVKMSTEDFETWFLTEAQEQWTPLIDTRTWANYRSLSGNEIFAARQAQFTEEVCFTVNWNKAVEPGMHIIYNDKVYEITRVDDFEGYKKDMRLMCRLAKNPKIAEYPAI